MQSSAPLRDFNGKLLKSINDTIADVFGQGVLELFHEALSEQYHMFPSEIPHRLDTVFRALEETVGAMGARALSWAITKDFYSKIGLRVVAMENYTLQNYVDLARKELLRRKLV